MHLYRTVPQDITNEISSQLILMGLGSVWCPAPFTYDTYGNTHNMLPSCQCYQLGNLILDPVQWKSSVAP